MKSRENASEIINFFCSLALSSWGVAGNRSSETDFLPASKPQRTRYKRVPLVWSIRLMGIYIFYCANFDLYFSGFEFSDMNVGRSVSARQHLLAKLVNTTFVCVWRDCCSKGPNRTVGPCVMSLVLEYFWSSKSSIASLHQASGRLVCTRADVVSSFFRSKQLFSATKTRAKTQGSSNWGLVCKLSVGCVTTPLDAHVWVLEQTIPLQEAWVLEALQYYFEIRCTVQWWMLWFSAPTSPNKELLNDVCDPREIQRSGEFGHFGHLRSTFLEDETLQDLASGDRYVLYWSTRLRESGKIWWDGDWVRDLTCCLTMGTITTTWILRRNEFLEIFWSGWCHLLQEYEGIFVVCRVSLTFKNEIQDEKRSLQFWRGHAKDKFCVVVDRILNASRMASVSCVWWRSKLIGLRGNYKLPMEGGRKFPTSLVIWGRCWRMRKTTHQKCRKESFQSEQEVHVLADELKGQGSVWWKRQSHKQFEDSSLFGRLGKKHKRQKELLEIFQDKKRQQEDEMWKELEELIASCDTEKRRDVFLKHEDLVTGT